jgi:hypothetical protein
MVRWIGTTEVVPSLVKTPARATPFKDVVENQEPTPESRRPERMTTADDRQPTTNFRRIP